MTGNNEPWKNRRIQISDRRWVTKGRFFDTISVGANRENRKVSGNETETHMKRNTEQKKRKNKKV
ncbi:hypothetical protein DXB23_00135 [Dorea sp. OM02-2LB]|nr:hypothetical protein DXB23_00135 [Dorea sp. OM02-2LB]